MLQTGKFMQHTHLLQGTLHGHSQTCWQGAKSCIQEVLVWDAVLLKAVQEWSRSVGELWLPHNHYTLEVLVHTAWLVVAANGNVSIEPWLFLRVWVVNTPKVLVEQVIEALMNVICLWHQDSLPFHSSMTDGSNCVNLKIIKSDSIHLHMCIATTVPQRIANLLLHTKVIKPCVHPHSAGYHKAHCWPTFWSWLSSGKSLHMNVLVFFGSSILYISRSLDSESSSLGSMTSLYRTSSYVSWSPWRLRLGLSWRLSWRISMTLLCLSTSGDDFNCTECNNKRIGIWHRKAHFECSCRTY